MNHTQVDVQDWECDIWRREADRLKDILDDLTEQNERLRVENDQLRQQIRDVTAHPIGNAKGPVFFCETCQNPYLGLYSRHQCTRR